MEIIFECTVNDVIRVLGSAVIIYVLIIVYIRLLGKRSTSELNNFDWIVTVSVGSIVASTIVLKDLSVTEGGLSIFILMMLQFLITKFMYNSVSFREFVKSNPQLLLFEGEFIEENMKKERILKREVYAAIRQNGLKSVKQIYAVVLETNSKISIINNENPEELGSSLIGVQGLPNKLKENLKNWKDKNTETSNEQPSIGV